MKISLFLFVMFFVLNTSKVFGQEDRRNVRQGNRLYRENNFTEAELYYRRAMEQNQQNFRGPFNLGNALYRQERFNEAAEVFEQLAQSEASDLQRAKAFHNLGNSKLGTQNYAESIDAFKNALRLNPADNETRFNLAYAMQRLQQQQLQQQNQQNNQNQDPQNENNQESEQRQQPNEPTPGGMTREQAERILDAMNKREQALQRDLKKNEQQTRTQHQRDW
ncbi:MAG TPA: hypothetical protein DCM62_10405 [Bacteroidales bacterium]|nr:hypothetical protein [Bacteroidales bacterium]